MWIFTNKSFLSVVEHYDQKKYKDVMVVRARRSNDLKAAFPHAEIIETFDSDYRFRVFVTRRTVQRFLNDAVDDIDYDNFKDSIAPEENERHSAYLKVWMAMNSFQDNPKKRTGYDPYFDYDLLFGDSKNDE